MTTLNIFNGKNFHEKLFLIFQEIHTHFKGSLTMRNKIFNQKKILNTIMYFDILSAFVCSLMINPWINTADDEAYFPAVYFLKQIGFCMNLATIGLALVCFYICFVCICGVWTIVAVILITNYDFDR